MVILHVVKMEVYNCRVNMLKVSSEKFDDFLSSSVAFLLFLKLLLVILCLNNFFQTSFPEGVAEADLVLLVTTRPTTGNTLAWAVACERDQWGRAIAGTLLDCCLLCKITLLLYITL